MSGPAGRLQSIADAKRAVSIAKNKKIQEMRANRLELMQAIAGYLKGKYGDNAFVEKHPLVEAVMASAGGSLIDVKKLQEASTEYDNATKINTDKK